MKEEALRLALEALEPDWELAEWYVDKLRDKAIPAIKQALAHPEPEPVAWTDIDFTNIYISEMVAKEKSADVPLYTSQPKREWQGLTDDEICSWFQENTALTNEAAMRITRAIEAKLKEKNTWQDGDCKHCVNGCPACDARRQPNVLP